MWSHAEHANAPGQGHTDVKTDAFASVFKHQFVSCMMMCCISLVFTMIFSMLQCFTLAQCLFLNEISAILHFPTFQSTLTQGLKVLNNLLV